MTGTRKALCVGINEFKNYPSMSLNGCVNDADDMEELFKRYLGFTGKGDIVKLTDKKATRATIMKNLESMVNDAIKGKYQYLAFSLSSHGTQVPDAGSDEPDNLDEAFVPYDIRDDGKDFVRSSVIVDDDLSELFKKLPKTVQLEVFLDTCCSGTGLKAINFIRNRKIRWMPPPSVRAFKMLEKGNPRSFGRSMLDKGISSHILWAACRADQTSADDLFGERYNGAFTYYFKKSLEETKNKVPRRDLLKKVKTGLDKGDYPQTSQLEGPAAAKKKVLGA